MGVIIYIRVNHFYNWLPYPLIRFLRLNANLNYSFAIKEGARDDMRLIPVRAQKAHIVLAPFY